MIISKKGIALIKSFEQCKLQAYKIKTDPWTIGWGNTFYRNGKPVKKGDSITQLQADDLFQFWLGAFSKEVEMLVTTEVNQNQFDALVSFAYNCGTDIDADTIAEGLGDSTLLKKVNRDPNDPTIRDEFMKWISKGSIFETGLKRRRSAEANLYFSSYAMAA